MSTEACLSFIGSKQEEFASVMAWVEGLRGRMAESTWQVERLFESFGGGVPCVGATLPCRRS